MVKKERAPEFLSNLASDMHHRLLDPYLERRTELGLKAREMLYLEDEEGNALIADFDKQADTFKAALVLSSKTPPEKRRFEYLSNTLFSDMMVNSFTYNSSLEPQATGYIQAVGITTSPRGAVVEILETTTRVTHTLDDFHQQNYGVTQDFMNILTRFIEYKTPLPVLKPRKKRIFKS